MGKPGSHTNGGHTGEGAKTKRPGLPGRSLSPRVENVWVRTPQVGNMVWHVFETSRSEKSQYFVDNYCYTWITSSLSFTNYQPCRYVVSVDKVLLISNGFDNLKITTVVCWYTPWRYYFWLISPWQRKRDDVGFMDKNLNLFDPTLLMCLFLLDTLSDDFVCLYCCLLWMDKTKDKDKEKTEDK